MTSETKKPTLVAGTANPANASEIKHDSEGGAEAQDANEALRDAVTDEGDSDHIPGMRQSGIRGSAD